MSFPGLYIELWTKKILLSIARVPGKPIAIDQKTLDHDVGNYAAVLIDIDFAKLIPERIRLKANGIEFWQYVEIQDLENIKFCSHCKYMGHKFENCLAARRILGGKLAGTISEETGNPHATQINKRNSVNALRSENKHSKYAWKEVRGKKKNGQGAFNSVNAAASVASMYQFNKEKQCGGCFYTFGE